MENRRAVTTRRWIAPLFLALFCHAADYDPVDVLRRAREKALATIRTIPRYSCVETVTRDYYEPVVRDALHGCNAALLGRAQRELRLYSVDRLRLEVTLTNSGEAHSWSGASTFETGTIDQLVRRGPMSTGSFVGYLAAVFQVDAKKLAFQGTRIDGKRTLLLYDFEVPKADSHYRIRDRSGWFPTDYAGTVEIDPQTSDVVRLRITTGILPETTGFCGAANVVEFSRVKIGLADFLLPNKASYRYLYPAGDETENTVHFSACREFKGEANLVFGPPEEKSETRRIEGLSGTQVPGGIPFTMALTQPIVTDRAAAGDPFTARLTEPLIDEPRQVLIPIGTPVEGRLVRVQSFLRTEKIEIVMRPEALRINGVRVPFQAVRDWTRLMMDAKKKGKKGVEIIVTDRGERFSGGFRFAGKHVTVPKGFKSEWKTATP
jgi:hypothetical protein